MAEITPEKKERNEKIFTLKQDKEIKTTFKTLATMFDLSGWRVKEIYYNECKKRGVKIRKYTRRRGVDK